MGTSGMSKLLDKVCVVCGKPLENSASVIMYNPHHRECWLAKCAKHYPSTKIAIELDDEQPDENGYCQWMQK